ncbi:MAG: LysM peptidoglycan-binding domain-containing protein [Symbiobacterium sp.]|uniref:LysM peptidoglycan-binding domain-containing protein n=1 Tax=Symbiobacterium sp. TaxID=1971213 RepID=UPI0034644BB5
MAEQGPQDKGGMENQYHRRWRGGGLGRLLLVTTGDLDLDGVPEIVACAGRELKVYHWTGDTYALLAEVSLPKDALSLAAGQIDPDGPGTVAVGTRDNVLLYALTPDGLTAVCQTLLYPNAYFRSISLDDVNDDGQAEVVAGASGAQTMYLYQVMAVGRESRLEELGRLYVGGLVAARPTSQGEVVTATKDGFVDVYVPCSLLPRESQTIYTVRRGDSLWRLARKFGTSPGAIARANKLQEPYQLTPGQVLIIPGRRGPKTTK